MTIVSVNNRVAAHSTQKPLECELATVRRFGIGVGGIAGMLILGIQDAKGETFLTTNATYGMVRAKIISDPGSLPARTLSHEVLWWLCKNPGKNASHVAEQFRIDPEDAANIVNALLAQGVLELA